MLAFVRRSTFFLAAALVLGAATALEEPLGYQMQAPEMRKLVLREVRRRLSFCCSDCDAVAESMRATLRGHHVNGGLDACTACATPAPLYREPRLRPGPIGPEDSRVKGEVRWKS
jgi:hypothetical protein